MLLRLVLQYLLELLKRVWLLLTDDLADRLRDHILEDINLDRVRRGALVHRQLLQVGSATASLQCHPSK